VFAGAFSADRDDLVAAPVAPRLGIGLHRLHKRGLADARAALTALLWQKGSKGEAESNWAAASGLDPRYRQGEWLLETRRWPPKPVAALEQFLALES
jgi:hypothetical protein